MQGQLRSRCVLVIPQTYHVKRLAAAPARPILGEKTIFISAGLPPQLCCINRQPSRKPSRSKAQSIVCLGTATAAAAATTSPEVAIFAVIIGWVVIAGSTIRSLPQILRILKNRSVKGLSLMSFLNETIAYTITVSYNQRFRYPFSTYGDVVMCWLQNLAIVGLIFHYRDSVTPQKKIVISLGIVAGSAWLLSGACPEGLLTGLQAMSVGLIALGGRLPQILLNWRRGNSGELSSASTGLSLAGNVARVFTTITLVGDPVILAGAISQLILNSILLLQTIDTARQVQRVTVQSAM